MCMRMLPPFVGSLAFIFGTLLSVAPPAEAQLIIAHRGASYAAPENTLAAFRLAWEKGADGVEGDFHLSRDGQIVCIHDKTTKRTAGVDLAVADTTLAELRKLDVGAWKGAEWAGERMPTIEEVFATVPDGKLFFIEVKCGPEIVPHLERAIEQCLLKPAQITIISFNADVIAACEERMPHIKTCWLTGYRRDKKTNAWTPSRKTVLNRLKSIQADGLDTKAEPSVVDTEFVRSLRGAGQEFHIWTVDDPETARHFQKLGVDSITTNRPAFLRRALAAP